MKKYSAILFFVFIGMFFFQSCKTTRDTTSSVYSPSKEAGYSVLKMEDVLRNQFSFDWMSARLSIASEIFQGIPINGQIRIRKDSVIWISLNALGFYEVGRIKATRDSLFVLNKHNNEYFAGNYRILEEWAGIKVNYDMLEALLLGNDFNCFDTSDYQTKNDVKKIWVLFTNRKLRNECAQVSLQKLQNFDQKLIIDSETYKILQNTLSNTRNQLQIDYNIFQRAGNMLFPSEVFIYLSTSSSSNTQSMKISFQKPVLGQNQTFPFHIPANVTPMIF